MHGASCIAFRQMAHMSLTDADDILQDITIASGVTPMAMILLQ